MADLVSRLSVDDRGFKQTMDSAASAVESTTARMNRALATVDRTGRNFQAVESRVLGVSRALNDATGALSLFGAGGVTIAQRLQPLTQTLSGVADTLGALGAATRGTGGAGAASGLLGNLARFIPALGAVATGATLAYGAYRRFGQGAEAAAQSQQALEDALRFAEDRLKSAADRARELAEAKEKQARATVEAAQATLREAIAQRQADLAFAQSAAAEAARQAQNPARRGTLRQGTVGQALQGAGAVEREIIADIGRLNAELDRVARGLANLNAPAASAASGLRTTAAAAQVLEQTLARLRAGPAGQTYAAGLAQIGEAAQTAGQVIQENLTPYQRYVQELERIGTASETILARQGQAEGEATIRRATESALQRLREQEAQTNRAGNAARELGLTFSSAFEDAVVGGKKLSDVLKGLSTDLARLIARRTITEPLANAASSALNSVTSGLGSLFSGGGSGGGTSLVATGNRNPFSLEALLGFNPFNFGGGRASGGPVAAGTTYLVGERGPELFTPSRSGEIIPNGGFGGGGGESITVNVDARGSSISPAELRAAVLAGVAQARALVRDDLRRDPGLRAIAQGRA